ncbi:hypothetical protein V5O48_013872 [Marasmius crinis-equi]|uniref:Pyridoxal-dependent decarboxylase n=1 Tax=Marasmius crinis-equi TaxID=585013 RepID=A0ABR3EYW2_9AGAR
MSQAQNDHLPFLKDAYHRIRQSASSTTAPLPTPQQLSAARASLPNPADPNYLSSRGIQATLDHLLNDIAPALNGQNQSSRYWGFVTGGSLPIAEIADNIVSAYDQNVSVHLPGQSIATEVEDAALKMLIKLLDLGEADVWEGRTFTTGATGSNTLGLACGREGVIQAKLPAGADGVGELGILAACLKAGIKEIQVLTSMGHSSLSKAASVVGLGRSSVKELPYSADEPWRLDLVAVERELKREGVASIISVSAGEVNTGRFATTGKQDMEKLRVLADRHGAWIHVDGAFGIFARALPATKEFARLREYTGGLELADSITVDGHKLLNVPYDCGMFFTRKASVLTSVCKNPNAAYLSSGASDIQSPLNVGLENSRRFRALPAYAVLLSEGREKIAEILTRTVRLTRGIAEGIRASDDFVLLPDEDANIEDTHIIVLFRAKDDSLNDVLVDAINKGREWYVSGTSWNGKKAVRIAVSNWRVDEAADLEVVKRSLKRIVQEYKSA